MPWDDDDVDDYEPDEFDSDEADNASELEGVYDDDEPTIPCPYCRREILEDVAQCPYCEQYISREDAPPASKPWWIVIGAIVCMYIAWRWIVG
ncbi:MAG: hypothetical protein AB7U73_23900 [Pirellulales bacterium]